MRTRGAYLALGMHVRFCDEFEHGFGWIVDEFLERCSHALVADGRVWLLDAVEGDGVEERVRAAGEPAGVIQLLDRHERGCAALAQRLGVPHHVVPTAPIEGAPFEFRSISSWRFWRETALWWPETQVLACGDALQTLPAVRVGGERVAVHPLLRALPPRRSLGGLEPRHLLCGHGEGVHGDEAAPALSAALANARRGMPRAWIQSFRASVQAQAWKK
jgi:hypothetical protein